MSDDDLEQDELETTDEDDGEELATADDEDDGDGDVVLRTEHVDAVGFELLAHAPVGSVFKMGRFGMAVEILEKGAHFAFIRLGFIQKIHGIHAFL